MKRTYLLFIALLSLVALPLSASAAFMRSGETISLQEQIGDDLYAAGQNVTVAEAVQGDAAIGASIIVLSGKVEQDALLGGGTITIGDVGDDLRVGGGSVTLNGTVGDDVFVGAGNTHLTSTSVIEGDLTLGGGVVIAGGMVKGETKIGAGDITLSGEFTGPMTVRADRITVSGKISGETTLAARQIILADGAQIAGAVSYWQQTGELDPGSSLIDGGSLTYDAGLEIIQPRYEFPTGALFTYLLVTFLMGVAVLLAFVLLDKKDKAENAARVLSSKYWKSLLSGFIFVIVTPVIGVLLCITVIGLPIGLFTLAMYGFIMYAMPVIASLVVAHWIDLRRTTKMNKWLVFLLAIGVLIVLKVLAFIPYIGGILSLLIVPATLGAFIEARRDKKTTKSE